MKFQKLTVILIAVFLFSLSACGGGGGGGDTPKDPGNQSQPGETVINGKA